MIVIQAHTQNSQPLSTPITAQFDEMGGSIGRSDGNTLVLPDQNRTISRNHAAVLFRAGGYFILDQGTATPVIVNRQELGNGREAPIKPGDEIRIGNYVLSVSVASEEGSRTVIRSPVATPTPPTASSQDDPLALFGGSPSSNDPFADLVQPVSSHSHASPPPSASPAAAASSGIPDDFDPFAQAAEPPLVPASTQLPDDFDLGLEPVTASQTLDSLFNLDEGAGSDPLGVLGEPQAEHKATGSQRDDTSELNASFRMPQPVELVAEPALEPAATPSPPDHGMVLSWEDDAPSEIRTMIIDSASQKPIARESLTSMRPPSPIPEQSASFASPAPPEADPAPPVEYPPVPAVPPAPDAANEALLRAFLQGAGMSDLKLSTQLTPQLMRIFGELLRESTQGTLDLLLARSLVKREVHAEVTMIVSKENNPLKFSPTVEIALAHLLAPQGRGFMTPVRAMRDAYNDLRSHQFGFMAGMRAALSGVLKRFNPEQLESRISQKSMIDSLIPMTRKAKLWEAFSDLYGEISQEAEDDFHALFGKEFLKAYQAQIEKLENEQSSAKP